MIIGKGPFSRSPIISPGWVEVLLRALACTVGNQWEGPFPLFPSQFPCSNFGLPHHYRLPSLVGRAFLPSRNALGGNLEGPLLSAIAWIRNGSCFFIRAMSCFDYGRNSKVVWVEFYFRFVFSPMQKSGWLVCWIWRICFNSEFLFCFETIFLRSLLHVVDLQTKQKA